MLYIALLEENLVSNFHYLEYFFQIVRLVTTGVIAIFRYYALEIPLTHPNS